MQKNASIKVLRASSDSIPDYALTISGYLRAHMEQRPKSRSIFRSRRFKQVLSLTLVFATITALFRILGLVYLPWALVWLWPIATGLVVRAIPDRLWWFYATLFLISISLLLLLLDQVEGFASLALVAVLLPPTAFLSAILKHLRKRQDVEE